MAYMLTDDDGNFRILPGFSTDLVMTGNSPAPSRARSNPKNLTKTVSGFSLVELLVVVAIVSVLTGMAVSTLSSKKGAEIGQAGGVASDLSKLARQYALAKNTRTALVVAQVSDGGVDRSAISVWDVSTTNQLEKWNLLPESVMATNAGTAPLLTLPTKFRGAPVTTADIYLFYPDGHMTEDLVQSPRLEIKPRTGSTANTFSIIFNPLTGLSRIERP